MKIKPKNLDFDITRDGVSQSLLGVWVKCRMQCKLQLEGWELPMTREAPAFGSLFHELLENAYNSIRKGQGVPDFEDLSARWLAKHAGSSPNMQMVELMLAKAEAIWEPYWEFWAGDVTDMKWVASEAQFDVDWKGFRLRGMRDGIFYAKDTPMLLESKTKTRVDPWSLLKMLPMDWQNLFYLTASNAEGIDVRHVLYNVIRRPMQRLGKTEELEDYAGRVRDAVRKDPEKYFVRFEVAYSPGNVARYQVELLQKLEGFRAWLMDPSRTYRQQQSCQGLWDCEFLEACSSGDMAGYSRTRTLHRELE